MPRKIVTSVTLDQEQVERLELLSQRTKIPKSVFIRDGLNLILEAYKDQLELFRSPASGVQPAAPNQPRL